MRSAGPSPRKARHRLRDLEGVADGPAQRGFHAGDEGPGADAVLLAEGDHGSGGFASPPVLHEGAGACLDVEDERVGPFGDLLGHDRAGDQRDRLDRPGHVAQRVQPRSAGARPPSRGDDALACRSAIFALLRFAWQPGIDSSLSRVPPVCPRPRPDSWGRPRRSWLPAARAPGSPCRRRPRWSACRRSAWGGCQVEGFAGGDHLPVQARSSARSKPVEVDRHQQGGHLLVGDLAGRVGGEGPADFRLGQRPCVVPLDADQRDDVKQAGSFS